MKKIIMGACMCAMSVFAADNVVTNVYDFKASLKVPYLENGLRQYKSQTLKGYMYVEYTDGEMTDILLDTVNTKSKVSHLTAFGDGFCNLMGKTTKTADRSVPSIYFEAGDVLNSENSHEFISAIQFAGTGSLKAVKSVTTGCDVCGEAYKTVDYCNVLYKMNGYATGYMDCLCPDEEEGWWHTVKSVVCGVFYDDDGNVERRHEAAVWGSWSATFNKKLSDTKIK